MSDRATEVALFRYALIREAADPKISTRERGRLVREVASRTHAHPDGTQISVGRSTVDDWIRAYRGGGFEALKPKVRALSAKVPAEMLHLAEALKRENPDRTAAHICELLEASCGWAPNERTIQRYFRRIGLTRKALAGNRRVFGRFEASRPNELWVGDALHGPVIARHKAILFAFLDDNSRLVPGWRWGTAEDTLRAEAALRRGLVSRGVPDAVYVDNGSPFVSAQLLRACASLRVRLIHSRPHRPPLSGQYSGGLGEIGLAVGGYPRSSVSVVLRMAHGREGGRDGAEHRSMQRGLAVGRGRCRYVFGGERVPRLPRRSELFAAHGACVRLRPAVVVPLARS